MNNTPEGEYASKWIPSGSLPDKLLNLIAHGHFYVESDAVPSADLDALQEASLILYYDAGYYITYDALAILLKAVGWEAPAAPADGQLPLPEGEA